MLSHSFNPRSESEDRLWTGHKNKAGNKPRVKKIQICHIAAWSYVRWWHESRSRLCYAAWWRLSTERWFMSSCAWHWDRREAAETSAVRGELCHIIQQVRSFVLLLPCHICQCGRWMASPFAECLQISSEVMCSIGTYIRTYFSSRTCNYKKKCFTNKNKSYFSDDDVFV